ncbi:Gfo/Idh/MocA family protein [Streptococcus moroccensis]|uniref:Dehydrogenase n=1 Tax=Streptococcus moroccensis TaxID=1451356 RepID=A0ABT9YSB0_9STRE|nr:Gfo/Idh/MocA family oxidoreductase [Streptococcus moroccensis]MDQ0222604.1 putative dehydrogenase [Streptococcus moroccensis]
MKELRIAVVGCGRIAQVYNEIFQKYPENIKVIAAVDIQIERAQAFAENFKGCVALTDYKDLGNLNIDIVHILTPHFLHAEQSSKLLEMGYHVLQEKPIAIELSDAKALCELANKVDKKLGVISQNRYITGIQKLKKLFDSGELGKLKGVSSLLNWWRPPSYYECDWKGHWETEGGGVVIDQAIHSLDLVRYIAGEEVRSVHGFIDKRVITQIEVEDVANALIEFKSGARYIFNACNYFFENTPIRIDFYFERGTAFLHGEQVEITMDGKSHIYKNESPQEILETLSYWGANHEKQVIEFYENIDNPDYNFVTPEDATKSLEIVRAIYKSSQKGEKVIFNH